MLNAVMEMHKTTLLKSQYEMRKKRASSCTVDSIVVPRELWERTTGVIKTIANSRKGSCGSIENVYFPPMMNRHGIDNLINEIRRHNNLIISPPRDDTGD